MLFGLTNTPATCQALVNNIIRTYLDRSAIAYLDNILIYSGNKEEHTKYIRDVLTYLIQAGLLLKPEKYKFDKEEVDFLGYMVTTSGMRASPEKVKATRE